MQQSMRIPCSARGNARLLFASFVCSVLAACGGGGGDGSTAPPPPPPTVASIEISPSSASVDVGETLQLTAQARDASGNGMARTMSWTSSDATKASVSGGGVVTGVAEASSVTISATTDGKTGTATIVVRRAPVALVVVSLASAQLLPGQNTQALAALRDVRGNALSGRSIVWSTANQAVATVSSSGIVTAVAPGQTQIVATSEGQSASASLTVAPPPVASIALEPSAAYLFVGEAGNFAVTLRDAGGIVLTDRTIAWSSSAPNVATVATNGLVTGVTPGVTTITATSEGKSASAQLTVVAPPEPVATVTLEPSPGTLFLGDAGYFTVTLKSATGAVLGNREVAWSSSAPATASVAADGKVSGLAVGSALITATSEGKSGSAVVVISPRPGAAVPVASVTLEPAQGSLTVGAAGYFTLTLRDAGGNVLTNRVVTWSSSAPSIASVGTDGLVVGISPGSAVVTATSEGRQGSASVTVIPKPTYSPSVCSLIGGGRVIANDGKFIGSLTNKYNSESVLNDYGQYGGRYAALSIYNPYGAYGSPYQSKSAYNPYTSTPPRITFSDGSYFWLTVNTTFPSASSVSPDFVKTCTNFP